jgi:hypothetical protein
VKYPVFRSFLQTFVVHDEIIEVKVNVFLLDPADTHVLVSSYETSGGLNLSKGLISFAVHEFQMYS